MTIKLTTKDNDITVYDKVNINHATGNEVIPLSCAIYGDVRQSLIHLICAVNDLTTPGREIYCHILDNYTTPTGIGIKSLIANIARSSGKHILTYKRAIDGLVYKGILTRNSRNGYVSLREEFNVNVISDVAKYIVIDVSGQNKVGRINPASINSVVDSVDPVNKEAGVVVTCFACGAVKDGGICKSCEG